MPELLLSPVRCEQVPKTSDGADDALQNESSEVVDSTRKSGKQRDKDGQREGDGSYISSCVGRNF